LEKYASYTNTEIIGSTPCLQNWIPKYSTTSEMKTFINNFWQRGLLLNYLLIVSENHLCSFHRNSSTIADNR